MPPSWAPLAPLGPLLPDLPLPSCPPKGAKGPGNGYECTSTAAGSIEQAKAVHGFAVLRDRGAHCPKVHRWGAAVGQCPSIRRIAAMLTGQAQSVSSSVCGADAASIASSSAQCPLPALACSMAAVGQCTHRHLRNRVTFGRDDVARNFADLELRMRLLLLLVHS